MTESTKTIPIFISDDGLEFTSKTKCKEWEDLLIVKKLHKNLLVCNFHQRCKIRPYFHNSTIEFIGSKYTSKELEDDGSYTLMRGRMGNGDDRVRYKVTNKNIKMIKYCTDDNEQELLALLPIEWLSLSLNNLKTVVEEFILFRDTPKE